MKLANAFTVPAAADDAFAVLLDVERVAPCLPGAALAGGDGETFDGAMTIKLGPVTSRFEGTVRIVEADRGARRAVLRAEARDARGSGTAAATITTSLRPEGAGTRVDVETDLQVSGPVAQFGRGVMQDVSGKLMRQFADCLAAEMGAAGRGAGGRRGPRAAARRAAVGAGRRPRVRGDAGRPAPQGPRRRCRAGRRARDPRAPASARRPTSWTWAPRRAAPCSSAPCPSRWPPRRRSAPSSPGGRRSA